MSSVRGFLERSLGTVEVKDGVDLFKSKNQFEDILERVQKGECLTLTKHGVPVAILTPVQPRTTKDRRRVIDELREFGRGRKLPERLGVRDLINKGRRF